MEFNQINNSESGLTVRGKLNSMLSALIEGVEGVGAIWTRIRQMAESITANKALTDEQYQNCLEGIQQANHYTDKKTTEALHTLVMNKGYYSTSEELIAAWPTASFGSQAYVGSTYPYEIWRYGSDGWVNTGETGGDEEVPLANYLSYDVIEETT